MGFLSNIFGGKKSGPSPELMEAFKQINRIIEDEEFQISILPEQLQGVLKQAPAVDVNPGATGDFGLCETNPIPVNGAIGELAYLSKLEAANGDRLLFHRIGAVGTIDVFEAVTFSGGAWFVFFVDMYHPRKSRKAPSGFSLSSEVRQFSGFHNTCKNFPYDYPEVRHSLGESILSLAYMPTGNVIGMIQKKVFERPLSHKAKLDIIRAKMTSCSMA